MKKLLLTGVTFTALIASPAMAADLVPQVYRRPIVVAAPVYSWTGFYIGGNVGYSWGSARTDIAGSGTTAFSVFISTINFVDSNNARLNGVIGGGQIGYNYQASPHWVLGIEADIQGSGERASNGFGDSLSTTICNGVTINPPITCVSTVAFNGQATTAYDAKIGWFGTLRGRVGVLVDDVLIYGTGGLAYGDVSLSGSTRADSGHVRT